VKIVWLVDWLVEMITASQL